MTTRHYERPQRKPRGAGLAKTFHDYLGKRGVRISRVDAETLRKAQLQLHRWDEACCGLDYPGGSWAIERDDDDGTAWKAIYPHHGESRRELIADRETRCEARVRDVCERNGLAYYRQTDPRGCSLYVAPLHAVAGLKLDEVYPSHMTGCIA